MHIYVCVSCVQRGMEYCMKYNMRNDRRSVQLKFAHYEVIMEPVVLFVAFAPFPQIQFHFQFSLTQPLLAKQVCQ